MGLNKTDLGRVREYLLDKRHEFQSRQEGWTEDVSNHQATGGSLDMANDNANTGTAGSLSEVEAVLANDVEVALQSIQDGTYGRCIECDLPILRERLNAIPSVKRCQPCQVKAEGNGHAETAADPYRMGDLTPNRDDSQDEAFTD